MNVKCAYMCALDENKAINPLPLCLIFILRPQARTVQGVRRKARHRITPQVQKLGITA